MFRLRCALVIAAAAAATSGQNPPNGKCGDPSAVCAVAVSSGKDESGNAARVYYFRPGESGRDLVAGTDLHEGDEVIATGKDAAVRLRCPKSAVVDISQQFRALILPDSGGRDCYFKLSTGAIDINGDDGSEVQSGEVTMGSNHTSYALRVTEDGELRREAIVYDGVVDVQAGGRAIGLTRAKLITSRAGTETRPLETVDIERSSAVMARLDLVRIVAGGTPAPADVSYASLKSSYARVLANPADADARVELATAQVKAKLPDQALLQLRRVQVPNDNQKAATVEFTRSIALTQLGRDAEAKQSEAAAVKLDPEIRARMLSVHRLEPGTMRRIQRDK